MADEEHIPSPFEWTEEERRRFAMAAQHCPMCQFKYMYANLKQVSEFATQMEEQGLGESPQYQAIINSMAQQTDEILALGLTIAHEQCSRNARVVQGMLN